MTELEKAARQALEALELYQSKMSVQMFDAAIASLRRALEQLAQENNLPRPDGSVVSTRNRKSVGKGLMMGMTKVLIDRSVLEQAFEFVANQDHSLTCEIYDLLDNGEEQLCSCGLDQTICVLKTAMSRLTNAPDVQPEHEPVAWMWKDGSLTSDPDEADGTWTKLYTAPPKREWKGLTDDDIEDEWRLLEARYLEEVDPEGYYGQWDREFVRAVLAKAKEKNS